MIKHAGLVGETVHCAGPCWGNTTVESICPLRQNTPTLSVKQCCHSLQHSSVFRAVHSLQARWDFDSVNAGSHLCLPRVCLFLEQDASNFRGFSPNDEFIATRHACTCTNVGRTSQIGKVLSHVPSLVPLFPTGGKELKVSEANKLEYVNALARHRMTTSIRTQIAAFLEVGAAKSAYM